MQCFFVKQNIPVAVLIQDFRVLPDRLFEVQSLSKNVINFGNLIIIEAIDSEDIEDVVELFAFVNVFSHTAGFVGPRMFWCSLKKSPVSFPNVFRTTSRAGDFVHDIRTV